MKRTIREYREQLGLSQYELAKNSGISQVTISRIESGRPTTCQPRTIRKLLNALGARFENLDLDNIELVGVRKG